ncbi:MAG: hypothetical protein ACREME_12225 [Gemmatimonadales bacterium]
MAVACGESPTSIRTYIVAYTLTAGSFVTFDSVRYRDTEGVLQKVVNPALPWGVAMPMDTGEEVEAFAWGRATQGGQDAKLKVTWTISGVSTAGDSSFTRTTAPGDFTLVLVRHRI